MKGNILTTDFIICSLKVTFYAKFCIHKKMHTLNMNTHLHTLSSTDEYMNLTYKPSCDSLFQLWFIKYISKKTTKKVRCYMNI